MAKKGKKFDAPEGTEQVLTSADVATVSASDVEGNGEAPAVPRAGWYLKTAVADKNGRTDYRFAKYAGYPKKPSEIPITIDGEPANMAVTSSGGWADEATKGYNGYIQYAHPTRGLLSGWILFGHGVNPREIPLDFTVTDGTCAANPKRIPANPDTEEARKQAFKAKMEAKKLAAAAAVEGGEAPVEGQTEQPAAS